MGLDDRRFTPEQREDAATLGGTEHQSMLSEQNLDCRVVGTRTDGQCVHLQVFPRGRDSAAGGLSEDAPMGFLVGLFDLAQIAAKAVFV